LIAAAFNWTPLFLIDAGTYIFSAITLLGVSDALRRVADRKVRIVDDIVAGLRFISRSPTLRSTMTLTTMAAVFMGMTFPTLVVLAYETLKAGASGYGFLEAVIGAGFEGFVRQYNQSRKGH